MDEDRRISYFLLGLGVGVAVGILFAPKSGADTRKFLKEKADEGADYVKRRSSELRESTSDILDRGKQAVLRQKDQLAAAVEAGKSAYREATAPRETEGADPAGYVEGV